MGTTLGKYGRPGYAAWQELDALRENLESKLLSGETNASDSGGADIYDDTVATVKSVSAPRPMPDAPSYDFTSWDDTTKGEDAWKVYNDAKDAVFGYGDFTYANQTELDAIMDSILNRKPFSYNFNEDAFYQMYKDKYTKQGKMAAADVMGQAAAMTGGYGNSYAATVGNQAYLASLENLNDVLPELYQMAYDRYNQEGQDLYNKYGLLNSDYERAYGEYVNEYNKLMDALGIARGDYYDGADMYYAEQSNANSIEKQRYEDAMAQYKYVNDGNTGDEPVYVDAPFFSPVVDPERKKFYDDLANTNTGDTESIVVDESGVDDVSDDIKNKLANYTTKTGQANFVAGLVNSGEITEETALDLLDKYMVSELTDRSWEMVDDGGVNWLWGVDKDAVVRDEYGKEYSLKELEKELKKTMTNKEAKDYVKKLQDELGI